MSLSFQLSPTADLEKAIAVLSPKTMQTILASAVKETASSIRTDISKTVREVLNLKKADADKNISVTARGGEGEVLIVRTPVPLKYYDAQWSGPQPVWYTAGNPPPASILARRGRGRESIEHAFISMKLGGHVFIRSQYKHQKFGGKTRRVKRISPRTGRTYWSELPITKQYGPTLLGVLENRPGTLDGVLDRGQEKLDERIGSKIDFVINGGTIGGTT